MADIASSVSSMLESLNWLMLESRRRVSILQAIYKETYLGVTIHKHLSWTPHITSIVAKTTRTLNFLKRNLSNTYFKTS